MAESAAGILGSLRILVDADTAKAQKALQSLGGRAQIAGAAIGAGLGLGAIGALRMGDTYDAALDGIRASTGATGDVLAGLEAQMNDVGSRVTESLDIVGASVATLHKRTGQVGDSLGATAESIIDLARLTETDYASAVDKISQLYVNWNIAAEDQVGINDMLLRAYQASGVSVDALTDSLDKNGAVLRSLGFDIEESAALLATLEKAGIDATAVMAPMKKALAAALEAGEDPAEAIEALFESIRNAPDDVTAGQRALEVFGTRGAQMGALIREGKLDVDDLFDTIAAGSETVQAASDDTRDWADGIKEVMNSVTSMVGPVTSAFAGISDALGNAIFLLPALGGVLGKTLVKSFQVAGNSAAVKGAAAAAGTAASLAYSAAVKVSGAIVAALASIWTAAGALGSRVLVAAGIAGGSTAAAYLAGIARGLTVVGIAAIVGEAINEGLRGAGVEPVGWKEVFTEGAFDFRDMDLPDFEELYGRDAIREQQDRLGEIFGPEAVADHIASWEPAMAAAMDGITAAMIVGGNAAAAAATGVGEGVGMGVAAGVRSSFKAASAEVAKGFGGIKDALANPPQLISKSDRLENMEARLRQTVRNMRKAVESGESVGSAYWEAARAKQQNAIDNLRDHNNVRLGDIKSAYRGAGVSVKGTWADVRRTTQRESDIAADSAVTAIEGIKPRIDAIDLASSGAGLMTDLAAGIRSGIPAVDSAASDAALAASRASASNPSGSASGSGGGGSTINVGTFVGNRAGLDELDRRLGRRNAMRGRGAMRYGDTG